MGLWPLLQEPIKDIYNRRAKASSQGKKLSYDKSDKQISSDTKNLKVLRFHDLLHEATSRLAEIFSTTRIDGNHGTSGHMKASEMLSS